MCSLAADRALHDTETRLARLIFPHVDSDEEQQQVTPRLINDFSHESLQERVERAEDMPHKLSVSLW